jgi:peptidylprolyl isomerase
VPRPLLLAVLAACAALAACGGSGQGGAGTEPAAPDGAGEPQTGASASDDLGSKPDVTVPEAPASQLQAVDVVEGDGPAAKNGDELTVQYVGVAQSTGQEFDASWDSGQPFTFELGAGMVIPGWDQGLEGMKVGGRRLLVIPGDLAYGPVGQSPDIGPDETLVFAVDLEKAK